MITDPPTRGLIEGMHRRRAQRRRWLKIALPIAVAYAGLILTIMEVCQ